MLFEFPVPGVHHVFNCHKIITPRTNADKVLFKWEVVDTKRVKLDNRKKLHIYIDKDGKYQFIDKVYVGGTGVSIQD